MTDEEYELIRIVVAYRLIARKVSYIAQVQRISEAAVKRILLEHGEVPRRGRRYWWSGPYTISEAKHKWLAFPDYIPLHIDGVSFQITNHPRGWVSRAMTSTFGVPMVRCARGATGKVNLFTRRTVRSMKLLGQWSEIGACRRESSDNAGLNRMGRSRPISRRLHAEPEPVRAAAVQR